MMMMMITVQQVGQPWIPLGSGGQLAEKYNTF